MRLNNNLNLVAKVDIYCEPVVVRLATSVTRFWSCEGPKRQKIKCVSDSYLFAL